MSTVNEKKKKSKAQLLNEKKINNSLKKPSRKTIKEMGILGVEPNEGIFQLNTGKIIRVYTIKGIDNLPTRKSMLVKSLCGLTDKRIRITSLMYSDGTFPVLFLSVFFDGPNYADAYDEIGRFDQIISEIMNINSKLLIQPCSANDLFMFIYMNYYSKLKKITKKALFSRVVNWKKEYFGQLVEKNNKLYFPATKRFGSCFMGIQFSEQATGLFEAIRHLNCGYMSCIEFQNITQKFGKMYGEYMEELYSFHRLNNDEIENELIKPKSLINFSFMLGVWSSSLEEKENIEKSIDEEFSNKGIVLSPCDGIEKDVMESITSMGLIDFHCMRNVNEDLVPELFG